MNPVAFSRNTIENSQARHNLHKKPNNWKKGKGKSYCNKNLKELMPLQEGEKVRLVLQPGGSSHRWIKAEVEEQADIRS